MKKNIIIAALLLLALGGTQAQDTLTMSGPKANYMCPIWYDTSTKMVWDLGLLPSSHAVGFHPHGEITVYGIAAIVMTPLEFYAQLPAVTPNYYPVLDTTMGKVGGYLHIYDFMDDTLVQLNNGLWVGKATTPGNYYLRFNFDSLYSSLYYSGSIPPGDFVFPVYERYFDSALTVTDSFFVGLTDPQFLSYIGPSSDTTLAPIDHHPVAYPNFRMMRAIDEPFNKPSVGIQDDNRRWSFVNPTGTMFYVFPILTPGENLPDIPIDTTIIDTTIIDTTIIDTTSVGIGDVQVVGRYVSLLPNPATDRVKVLSSFGLRRVEVYNAAGARVREVEARGYTATLRVDDLPEGAYLLRIHTPAGNTTKKLIVRR